VCLWIWLLRITSGLMRLRLFKLPSFLFLFILVEIGCAYVVVIVRIGSRVG